MLWLKSLSPKNKAVETIVLQFYSQSYETTSLGKIYFNRNMNFLKVYLSFVQAQ